MPNHTNRPFIPVGSFTSKTLAQSKADGLSSVKATWKAVACKKNKSKFAIQRVS